MPLVFQYGSNTLESEINSTRRLNGKAKFVDIAETAEPHEIVFDVFSETRGCATANIVPMTDGQRVWGVLYEVPDELIDRHTAKQGQRTLDAIEGEGKNHRRHSIRIRRTNGEQDEALTYVTLKPEKQLKRKASTEYVQLILQGLREHNIPQPYIDHVKSVATKHNPKLAKLISSM